MLSAGVVNLLVPSGGGQWAVQAPVLLSVADGLDVPLGTCVLAMAYGDQLTNMLQPFWALPLMGITGLEASQLLPYTCRFLLVGLVAFSTALLF